MKDKIYFPVGLLHRLSCGKMLESENYLDSDRTASSDCHSHMNVHNFEKQFKEILIQN
jgi:hypothetical protein